MNFEWDETKNTRNIKKHGISFEEAAYVFSDRDAISLPDEEHGDDETRWVTIGRILNRRIVVVVHTERIKGEREFIRIISAWPALKKEKEQYRRRIGGL